MNYYSKQDIKKHNDTLHIYCYIDKYTYVD